jgi:CheY-like chemotaxis protein
VVMVVDDDPLLRTCLAELLAEYGYDTLTESDGASALDLLDNLAPSSSDMPVVMLVDIVMPNMDGYELAAAIRSRSAVSTVPLIFMSSSAPKSPGWSGQDFLRKPFNLDRLMSSIHRAIPAKAWRCN